MSLMSLGDMAQAFSLRRHSAALKSDLQTASTEVTTGRVSDISARVRGDYSALTALDATLSQLDAFKATNNEAELFTGAQQTALATISGLTGDFGPMLLNAATGGAVSMIATIGRDAAQRFETVVAALNTRVGDRSLFAGQATDSPATAPAQDILSALDAATALAITPAEMETAINEWFDDPVGYGALGYAGGPPLAPVSVAQGEVANIDVTADDSALRQTLKALALGAMLDRGAFAGAPQARADVARRAGEAMINAQDNQTYLAARLGITEGQIAAAKTRNASETSALQIARTDLLAVDPYEAATRLQETQTRIETLYTLTARLSRLNLADYL